MRVALADDADLYRETLGLLVRAAGHQVVHSVPDGDRLLAALAAEPVDVAVLDIGMRPGAEGGIATARRARGEAPATALLLLSHRGEAHYPARVLEVGPAAVGYRLKDRIGRVDALAGTLDRLAAGETVLEPEVAARLVGRAGPALPGPLDVVLRLLAAGRPDGEIARDLDLPVAAAAGLAATALAVLGVPDAAYPQRVPALLSRLRTLAAGGQPPAW